MGIRHDSASDRPTETAFDAFYRASRDHVVGLIAVATRDYAAAEDAAQEAFARAYRRWGTVSAYERPDLWVVRVGIRISIDSWRKRRKEDADESDGHAAPVDDQVRDIWLRWGLDQLSPQQRVVVVLYYAEGLDRSEVAARLGTSKHTVKTHLERARLRLRELLGGDYRQ